MKKIITTVGTSILTNANKNRDNSEDQEIKPLYDFLEKGNYPYYDKWKDTQVQEHISGNPIEQNKGLRKLVSDKIKSDTNASAEIKSILKIVEESQEDVEVYLLATDTILSVLACELIQDWFNPIGNKETKERKKYEVKLNEKEGNEITKTISVKFEHNENHIIKDLRVDSKGNYEKGFMNLIEQLDKLKLSKNDILNITGGYKAIIPILTLYGQLKEIPLKYIYNESELDKKNELVTVGNLPINFDLGYIENYVNYIVNPNLLKVNNQTIINQMFDLGLLKSKSLPSELTVIGELIKNKLNSDDLPFEKTMMGYFVEYKLYEYYTLNKPEHYTKVTLGFRLSDDPNRELEDADLWFSNDNNTNVIAVEIKPISIKANAMRKKIRKNIAFTNQLNPPVLIKEFWIILYQFENNGLENEQVWCENVINQDIKSEFPSVIFRIKKITISQNIVDGDRNRIRYQEFMRSTIQNVDDIFSSIPNPITSQP